MIITHEHDGKRVITIKVLKVYEVAKHNDEMKENEPKEEEIDVDGGLQDNERKKSEVEMTTKKKPKVK